MRRIALLTTLTLAALTFLGCMVGETSHTLYLSADGEVTFSVLETAFRSDAKTAAERASEEAGWLADRHTAEALRSLHPTSVEVTVLRSERPYAVQTTASFPSVEQLVRDVLRELEVEGAVTFERSGRLRRLAVTVPEGTELGSFQIVLTEGRFVRAAGFTLSGDGAAAMPAPSAETRELVLEWMD